MESLNNKTVTDYFKFLLLTGMRRNEALELRWEDVNLDYGVVTVKDTKNGDDHALPLSDALSFMLQTRKCRSRSTYVFSGKRLDIRLTDWRHSHAQAAARFAHPFMLHDLRRTFITTADALDIPHHVIKRLVNHRSSDVTDGYIIASVERLRKPMQAITDEILRQSRMVAEK